MKKRGTISGRLLWTSHLKDTGNFRRFKEQQAGARAWQFMKDGEDWDYYLQRKNNGDRIKVHEVMSGTD